MALPGRQEQRPAYEQIAADIRTAIKAGGMHPGDPPPTEREHAARYGVAVGTYSQAVAMLREEGS